MPPSTRSAQQQSRPSTPDLVRAAEAAIDQLNTAPAEDFVSPTGSLSFRAHTEPATTPTSHMQQPAVASDPSVAGLLQQHGLSAAATAPRGPTFDPQWVEHRADNPVQRGPTAPEFCAPFDLAQDPRHQSITKGPSKAYAFEAEVLAWALSYTFDLLGFLNEAQQQEADVLQSAVGTARNHLSAVHDLLNKRVSELWVRSNHSSNSPLLLAITQARRGRSAQGCISTPPLLVC